MAKYFNGLSLLSAAGIVSETFVKLGLAWRILMVFIFCGSFILGLVFAKANSSDPPEEG